MKIHNRHRISILCLLMLLLGQTLAWAGGPGRNERFQEAAQSYSRGDYGLAIKEFESLAQENASAPLLYNLANSYAQAGQTGKAILNYERARRLAPGDSDIRGNLELVRKEKGLFQEPGSIQERAIGLLELNQWTLMAVVSFVLFGLVLLLPLSPGLTRLPRYVAAGLLLLLTLAAISGAVGQYRHYHDGVVIAPDARLRVSPFDSAASIGTIQEGRLVQPRKAHGHYFLVRDETGRSGWLEASDFESIALSQGQGVTP